MPCHKFTVCVNLLTSALVAAPAIEVHSWCQRLHLWWESCGSGCGIFLSSLDLSGFVVGQPRLRAVLLFLLRKRSLSELVTSGLKVRRDRERDDVHMVGNIGSNSVRTSCNQSCSCNIWQRWTVDSTTACWQHLKVPPRTLAVLGEEGVTGSDTFSMLSGSSPEMRR